MLSQLVAHINRFVRLTADEKMLLSSFFQEEQFSKKAMLLKEGQVCTAEYFVLEGCIRMYYVNEKGIEQIVQFGIDNWWITDYMSFSQQQPSSFCLQAVSTTKAMVLKKDQEESLLAAIPKMERYFRLIMQRAYAASQQRVRYFSELSGEERYHQFAARFPDFVQRVPQYMLASYLGFTPEFLSKIRAKKA